MCHCGIPAGVHVVFERNGHVLLMRRSGTGFFDGLFSLPGGHIEPGESIYQAAIREITEELNVTVKARDLHWLGVVHRLSDTNRIDFFLKANHWVGEPAIGEPDKCDGLEWFNLQRLPDNTVHYVREALSEQLVPWLLELGWK